jgi:hypothetical protein
MLVARRDPPFHVDARDAVSVNLEHDQKTKAPKVVRFVTVMQMVGSLVAVPVGIGSAYTFYRANFSAETTCQALRSGIIALLDKSVDASTRRILVRRDVETFEKTCATVDPEATAAFKTLLAAEKSTAPVAAAPPVPKVQANDAAPKEQVHKAEPRPQPPTKHAATPAVRKEPVSDTQWLDAVRQALVTHQEHVRPAESAKARPVPPPSRPTQREATPVAPAPAPASAPVTPAPVAAPATPAPVAAPVAPAPVAAPTVPPPAAAPVLPAPVAVAPAPAQQNAARPGDADHPVPPESIPDGAESQVKADEPGRSRIGKWISAIPLLGPVVDNGRR